MKLKAQARENEDQGSEGSDLDKRKSLIEDMKKSGIHRKRSKSPGTTTASNNLSSSKSESGRDPSFKASDSDHNVIN